MKLTPAQKVRLSAFLFVGVGLVVSAILWVGGTIVLDKRAHYVIRFTDDVSGLENSAQVKYRGFRVGRVERIRIDPNDARVIEVTLALKPDVPLFPGVKAQLDMSGLTGLRTVNLVGGDFSAARLPEGSEIPPDLSFIGQIVDQATTVAQRVNEIADNVKSWTRDENRTRFESILVSLDNTLRSLDKLLTRNQEPLAHTLVSVGKASESIATLSDESVVTMRALRDDVSEAVRAVRRPIERIGPDDIPATIKATRGVMVALEQRLSPEEGGVAIRNLGVAMTEVAKILQEADITIRASREDFTATMAAFRESAEDLREFSRILAQDPSALLRGREMRE
jgi:phospholipid/cholesterol/gamma-HCH transport system substrate-binding protein